MFILELLVLLLLLVKSLLRQFMLRLQRRYFRFKLCILSFQLGRLRLRQSKLFPKQSCH